LKQPNTTAAIRLILLAAFMACSHSFAKADALDDRIRKFMDASHIPGLSLHVLRDGKVVKDAAYGFANLELKVKSKPESLYETGSTGKSFTAAAILLLAEQGKLSIDDPVRKHLPSVPEAWAPITLRHLLTHTSGLPDYLTLPFNWSDEVRVADIVKKVAAAKPDFAPGEAWSYSNTGYALLGEVISKVSGTSYATFLRDNVLLPLKLEATRVNDPRVVLPGRSTGYMWNGRTWLNAPMQSPSVAGLADGALIGSARDLAEWAVALTSGKLLKPDSWKQASTSSTLNSGNTSGYGFGWFVAPWRGRPVLRHGGGMPGFSTMLLHFPDRKLTVAAIGNSGGVNIESLAWLVAVNYDPTISMQEVKPAADQDEKLTRTVQTLLATAGAGKLEESLFTKDARAALGSARSAGLKAAWQRLGKSMLSLKFLERYADGKDVITYYLLEASDGNKYVQVRSSFDGQIVSLAGTP
jgi:CubicO group peptidase (beta-lactamase class C family)